jgi:hypothetical protein
LALVVAVPITALVVGHRPRRRDVRRWPPSAAAAIEASRRADERVLLRLEILVGAILSALSRSAPASRWPATATGSSGWRAGMRRSSTRSATAS